MKKIVLWIPSDDFDNFRALSLPKVHKNAQYLLKNPQNITISVILRCIKEEKKELPTNFLSLHNYNNLHAFVHCLHKLHKLLYNKKKEYLLGGLGCISRNMKSPLCKRLGLLYHTQHRSVYPSPSYFMYPALCVHTLRVYYTSHYFIFILNKHYFRQSR